MRSNYKRIGDYIQEVRGRNSSKKAEKLLGINIDKYFMPSVANTIGTDLSVYKLVNKNQFACNRMHVGRDYRLPISISKFDEEFIVSPAYDVFRIKDESVLDPDFLMMWFSRKEFDRNAWYYTDADVRGGLPWKSFCDMKIPIPSIDKQREIVKEYNVIQDGIQLNEEMIRKLEETAQAIYRQWFVEFEFPDKDGQPYKGNGGEMVWNEEFQINIPSNWKFLELGDNEIIEKIVDNRGKTPPLSTNGERLLFETNYLNNSVAFPLVMSQNSTKYVSEETYNNWFRSGHPEYLDILIGTVGNGIPHWSLTPKDCNFCIAQNIVSFRFNQSISPYFVRLFFNTLIFKSQFAGRVRDTAQPSIKVSDLKKIKILVPELYIGKLSHKYFQGIFQLVELLVKKNQKLLYLKELLLSKLASLG